MLAFGLSGAALTLFPACTSFKPLYAEQTASSGAAGSGEPSTIDRLAQVGVQPIANRTGQQLHNLLRDRLNPLGQPTQPDYFLRIQVRERENKLGVRVDETATRANLLIEARYTLIRAGSSAVLTSGVARSLTSYNLLEAEFEFATVVSANDARERGLREVADELQQRLAAYFAGPGRTA